MGPVKILCVLKLALTLLILAVYLPLCSSLYRLCALFLFLFQWHTCDYEIRLIESIIIAELLPDNLKSRIVGLHLCGRPCCFVAECYVLTAQLDLYG